MSPTFFENVFNLLATVGQAHESMRQEFLYEMRKKSPTTEWRFQGNLGFGGKYLPYQNQVTCYPEDENPFRCQTIEVINEALRKLRRREIAGKDQTITHKDMAGTFVVLAQYRDFSLQLWERENEKDHYCTFEGEKPVSHGVLATQHNKLVLILELADYLTRTKEIEKTGATAGAKLFNAENAAREKRDLLLRAMVDQLFPKEAFNP